MLTELEKQRFELAEAQMGRKQRTPLNVSISTETYNKVVSILKGVHYKKGFGRVLTLGFLTPEDCKKTIEAICKKLNLEIHIGELKDGYFPVKSLSAGNN